MKSQTLLLRFGALALLLAPALAARAAPAGYRYDTVHSQVLFSITHNGYSRPYGMLHIARGWLRFDPDDFSTARTELTIDLASLDMGDAAWSKAVLAPEYLDVAGARYARFVSTSVTRTDARHGVIHGQLTLRGVTRPVDLDFAFNRLAATLYGMHTVAGFSATASFKRSDFGITSHPNVLGEGVTVYLQIEAIADDHAVPAPDRAS